MLPGFGLYGTRGWAPECNFSRYFYSAIFFTIFSDVISNKAESSAVSAHGARCDLNMLEKMLNLFGCRHAHLSVPFSMETARQNQAHLDWAEELPSGCSHYVVCLECGRRFGYDWSEMKVVKTKMKAAG